MCCSKARRPDAHTRSRLHHLGEAEEALLAEVFLIPPHFPFQRACARTQTFLFEGARTAHLPPLNCWSSWQGCTFKKGAKARGARRTRRVRRRASTRHGATVDTHQDAIVLAPYRPCDGIVTSISGVRAQTLLERAWQMQQSLGLMPHLAAQVGAIACYLVASPLHTIAPTASCRSEISGGSGSSMD